MDISRPSVGPPVRKAVPGPLGAGNRQVAPLALLALGDRLVIYAALCAVTLLAWLYLARIAIGTAASGATEMAMAPAFQWTVAQAWLTFLMWVVMMVAMMLPTASPMVVMYARMAAACRARWGLRTALFAAGYVAVWTAFSALATFAQAAAERAMLTWVELRTASLFSAVILVAAGLYQLTPLKSACLSRCRSPIGFLISEWREGLRGALVMGIRHGAFCVGCCWLLMALLFVTGVMNLLWCALIGIFVLLEKVAPWPKAIAWGSSAVLVGAGAWFAFGH